MSDQLTDTGGTMQERRYARYENDSPLADLYAALEAIPAWVSEAPCSTTDPEAFFPERNASPEDAKKVCFRCPVRRACLTYALDNDIEDGVWGGFSHPERRRIQQGAKPVRCAGPDCPRYVVRTAGSVHPRRFCGERCSRKSQIVAQRERRAKLKAEREVA